MRFWSSLSNSKYIVYRELNLAIRDTKYAKPYSKPYQSPIRRSILSFDGITVRKGIDNLSQTLIDLNVCLSCIR